MNCLQELRSDRWNIDDNDGSVIADYIETDGFDVTGFSLCNECVAGHWKFVKDDNKERGFIIFYDPDVVIRPEPVYNLVAGCVRYSYTARNITEAYLKHNRIMLDEDDFNLIQRVYSDSEKRLEYKYSNIANKYGVNAAMDVYNLSRDHIENLMKGNTMFPR